MSAGTAAGPFVARILAGTAQDDALAITTAVDDARAAGISAPQLLTAMASSMLELLEGAGFDPTRDLQRVLLITAQTDGKEDR